MRDKLKQIRISLGYTQEEVAVLIGVSRASYSNIELGHREPSLKTSIKIKEILNYYNDDIFNNIAEKKKIVEL